MITKNHDIPRFLHIVGVSLMYPYKSESSVYWKKGVNNQLKALL